MKSIGLASYRAAMGVGFAFEYLEQWVHLHYWEEKHAENQMQKPQLDSESLCSSNNKRPQPGLALLCKANYKQRVPAPTHRQCGEEESTDVDLRTQTFSGQRSAPA
ncbi:hypothetical protein Y1Q_0014775 [Alligator mississippiensis]|uniref:Uncharacterized protein n=1 Tax=Alligator mississippiensis TaxID=8496 RepID=A0A151M1Y7_ALLMI|nr:hypothetical protein Y1Q_0014775 [Alligator mississippiensis]